MRKSLVPALVLALVLACLLVKPAHADSGEWTGPRYRWPGEVLPMSDTAKLVDVSSDVITTTSGAPFARHRKSYVTDDGWAYTSWPLCWWVPFYGRHAYKMRPYWDVETSAWKAEIWYR